MIRIYTASNTSQAPRWRKLNSAYPELICHARWLKHMLIKTEETPENAAEFWLQDEQDVRDADVTLVFGIEGSHLRGALVEAGMSLAYGVPVVVVGEHPDYGTWQYHPGVTRAPDMGAAIAWIRENIVPRYRSMKKWFDKPMLPRTQPRKEFKPDLSQLIAEAQAKLAHLSPAEQFAAHWREQKRSYVRGELMLSHPHLTKAEVDGIIDRVIAAETRSPDNE